MSNIRVEIEKKGHRFAVVLDEEKVTITRDGHHAADGRWDAEAGITVEPYVSLLPTTDDSEDVYSELAKMLRAAASPS